MKKLQELSDKELEYAGIDKGLIEKYKDYSCGCIGHETYLALSAPIGYMCDECNERMKPKPNKLINLIDKFLKRRAK